MSKTGEWGDKVIMTLTSDGIRRHKSWCENYRASDKFCSVLCGKCVGSAFCEYYRSKTSEASPFYKRPDRIDPAPLTPRRSFYKEYYRRASWGDRLIHRTVLVKETPYTFRIGVVVDEEFHFFTVNFGGRDRKYEKRTVFRNDGLYIFTEVETSLDDEAYMPEQDSHICI